MPLCIVSVWEGHVSVGREPREEHGDQLSDVDGRGGGDGEKTPTGGEEKEKEEEV